MTDTATLFFFKHRDLTSMQEHYRGVGGYFRLDENGEITFLNLLYHTPRLGKAQMNNRSLMLFEEMVKTGNVKAYLGNRSFIHAPNNDFFYDAENNRWANTARSAWKFLDEAKN